MVAVIVTVFLLVDAAFGADYFVSSSRGLDTNPGTKASPWKSLARVGKTTLTPGDSVALHAGDIWHEPLIIAAQLGTEPISFISDDPSGQRPLIELDGAGTCITGIGPALGTVHIVGLELAHSTSGVYLETVDSLLIEDVFFRDVFNRSSIGQWAQGQTNPCQNGWSKCVQAGPAQVVSITNCLFDNIDVAWMPRGSVSHSTVFSHNTITRASGNTIFFLGTLNFTLEGNVFTRDYVPRYFTCGTTDIMIGGSNAGGSIRGNEIGWRGEHPAGPDGCAIDFEGGSHGVEIVDNFIHDSYGAGVMVFGLSDKTRNISNARLIGNVFMRNGAQQTSDDHGEISFMEVGSTGVVRDNIFFASDPSLDFVFRERVPGSSAGFVKTNNTVHGVDAISKMVAPTPQIGSLLYTGMTAAVEVINRVGGTHPVARYTLDGSLPTFSSPSVPLGGKVHVMRSSAVNIKFFEAGKLPSMTTTLVVTVPPSMPE